MNDDTNNKGKSIGCLSIVLAMVVFGSIKLLVQSVFEPNRSRIVEHAGNSGLDIEEALASAIKRVKSDLPKQAAPDLWAVDVWRGPGKTMVFKYRITSMIDDEIDISIIRTDFKEALMHNYKTNPEMKAIRDFNVQIQYEYHDKNDKYVTTVSIP